MNNKELERTWWATAKKLRNNSDPHTFMHRVSGLVFLRYITDVFDQAGENAVKDKSNAAAANAKSHEENLAYNEYFVPKNAQWNFLQSNSRQLAIGELIDDAIHALEKLNENLREIFPSNYADPALDKSVLGELVELTGNIGITKRENKKKDSFAGVFEYFLQMFAQEGKTGDQFYTPEDIARLLVEMAEPRQGKVYDGCCGIGATFVESIKFLKKYRGNINDVTFYGQDNNAVIIKIAKMNLIIHGIDANLQVADAFEKDCYPDLQADFILAIPPFNLRTWKGDQLPNDKRWKYGIPPAENENYAWLQHFISKLSESGTAGIVLSNNSINSNSSEERKIRKNLIEARLIDCIVTLPSNLFYNIDTPVCLWLLAKNKTNNKNRNPGNEILFIDARKLSVRSNRRKRELTDEIILLISRTYHRWRNINGDYIDLKRFCKAVSLETVSKNGYSLVPQKYLSPVRAKKIFASFLLIIFLGVLYFSVFKNGLLTSKSTVRDTALTVQSKIVKDNLPSQKKESKTIKKKEKEKAIKANDSVINTVSDTSVNRSATVNKTPIVNKNIPEEVKVNKPVVNTVPDKPVNRTPAVEKNIPEEPKDNNSLISYKVISKAYFYDQPDETTRRRAYITHWNNSYADIRALDEKNGFIYVVFTNHLHQRSKGWLRKMDLKEGNQ